MTSNSFTIHGLAGQKTLRGEVRINGAKNAALKAMAAALLFDGPVILKNVPKTVDIETLSTILKKLGASVEWQDHSLAIDSSKINSTSIDAKLAGSMRASVVLTGPLLARYGSVSFPAPGGCVIGARPIDLFLSGYKAMGARTDLDEKECIYKIGAAAGLKPAEIAFKKISVGATETLMMAAVLTKGRTVLKNCAQEPEIQSVAEWLNECGADIKGAGTPTIEIEGTNGALLSAKKPYVTIPDRIEAGSFLILGALCAHESEITDCRPDHLRPVIEMLKDSGVPIETNESSIMIRGNTKPSSSFRAFDVTTKEYPGFPTDLQPLIVAYLTQVSGTSIVHETIYEGRFKYIDDLKRLGARIETLGEQKVSIKGSTPFKGVSSGQTLTAHDIRAGFAIVMAALVAEGESTVTNIHLIDRGYEKLEERLRSLGAKIERV